MGAHRAEERPVGSWKQLGLDMVQRCGLRDLPSQVGSLNPSHLAGDRSRHSAASGDDFFMPFAIDLPCPLPSGLIPAVLEESAAVASIVAFLQHASCMVGH